MLATTDEWLTYEACEEYKKSSTFPFLELKKKP